MRIRLNAGLAAMFVLPLGALALGVFGVGAQPGPADEVVVSCSSGTLDAASRCCRVSGGDCVCPTGMASTGDGQCGCAAGTMFVPGGGGRPDRCVTRARASTAAAAQANLTPVQMLAEAERIYSRGQSLAVRVQGMLDTARREGDVLKVTCLDDKLTQVNAHVRTLGNRVDALREAARLRDLQRTNHEYTVIVVIGNQIIQLDQASAACIGQDMYETGTTRVVTTIGSNVPNVDPRNLLIVEPEAVPFIPAPASASM